MCIKGKPYNLIKEGSYGCHRIVEHKIDASNAHPIEKPLRRVDEHVSDMLKDGAVTFECPDCDYAAKRKRDLRRHAEYHHRAGSLREGKTDDLRKDPGDLIGLTNLSKEPAAVREKKRGVDDSPVFAPPRKISCDTQGDAPEKSKTQSRADKKTEKEDDTEEVVNRKSGCPENENTGRLVDTGESGRRHRPPHWHEDCMM